MDCVFHQEEVLWFQKSRANWIKSGYRNTSYYHATIVVRRSRNKITSLRNSDGNWIEVHEDLKKIVNGFFQPLFVDNSHCDVNLAYQNCFSTIEQDLLAATHAPFDKEDIRKALFNMAAFKALDRMAFKPASIRECGMWWKIRSSVLWMSSSVLESYLKMLMILCWSSFRKFILRKEVSQLRPISLCNICYKIITKALTNRLKRIMPILIGPNQSSFYQEVLHSMRMNFRRVGMMVLKIDLQKAYDRLSWDFIRDTLVEMGLNED